jgi:N4-gp56 family major capsid protein
MAVSVNATFLTNLIDPEVIGDMLDTKLIKLIKFAPLADVDTTLVGQPGSTITVPTWKYIGKASVTAEGQPITVKQLSASTSQVTVKKVAIGVELTDESVLSGYGDPVGQSVQQLALSIADAIDDELVTAAQGATAYAVPKSGAVSADDIADSLTKFGEDIDGEKVAVVNPADYATLRKAGAYLPASEMTTDIIIKGVVGELYGCQIVVSERIDAGKAVIVKPGALSIILKRDTMIESDRDIINKSTVLTADKHFTAYLKDATKAIYLS